MTITAILLIMAAIVVVGVVLGAVVGFSLDDKSSLLGAVGGLVVSFQFALVVGVVLAVAHFLVKWW